MKWFDGGGGWLVVLTFGFACLFVLLIKIKLEQKLNRNSVFRLFNFIS